MPQFTSEEVGQERLKYSAFLKNKSVVPDYFVSRASVHGRYGFIILRYEKPEGRITAILEFLQNAKLEIGYDVLDYHIDPKEPGKEYFYSGGSVGFYVGVFVTLDRM